MSKKKSRFLKKKASLGGQYQWDTTKRGENARKKKKKAMSLGKNLEKKQQQRSKGGKKGYLNYLGGEGVMALRFRQVAQGNQMTSQGKEP